MYPDGPTVHAVDPSPKATAFIGPVSMKLHVAPPSNVLPI